jgi:hypothetical protein
MKLVQMSNAENAQMRGVKLRNTAIHANVLYNGGAGDITLNRKKQLRNMTSSVVHMSEDVSYGKPQRYFLCKTSENVNFQLN